jgi:hypothetical protein
MGNARSFQERPTDHGAVLSRAASRVKGILLAFALAVGAASTATADPLTINTDSSWLATNVQPAAAWSSDLLFNTAGWTNAFIVNSVNSPPDPCFLGASCIWYDNQNSSTQFIWLRKTFTIPDPFSVATLVGGFDDDGDIYVNGILVYSDHNGIAEGALSNPNNPLFLTQYLHLGDNLIAVAAQDNFAHGQNHLFVAHVEITSPQAVVPEPASLVLLVSSLAGLVILRRRKRQS